MPALNSYILFSHVSNPFRTQMEAAIDNLNIPWWQTTHLPIHLTLGQCMGVPSDTQALILRRNATFETLIKNLIEKNQKNSAFLLPANIEITNSGWIILKYQTLDFETNGVTGTQPTNINQIHIGFEKTVSNLKKSYTLIPDPWGRNFMPHISMGRVKTKNANGIASADEIEHAQQALEASRAKIIDELIKLRPLNLYDLELVYNNTQGQTVTLYKIQLARRNFNIDSVIDQTSHIDINFKNVDGMYRFINFLTIISGEQPAQANKLTLTLQVSPQNYLYLVGLVDGCRGISIPNAQAPQYFIAAQTTPTEQKPVDTSPPKFQLNAAAPVFQPRAQLNTPGSLFQTATTSQQPIATTAPAMSDLDVLKVYGVANKKNVTRQEFYSLNFSR